MSALFVLTLALRRFGVGGAAMSSSPSFAAPATGQPQQSSAAQCREETITLDEGYGLRGQETRVVCGR